MNAAHMNDNLLLRIAVGAGAFPDNLVTELFKAKDGIQDNFQIMASH